ncbi:uncharacterized protein LOC117331009 [Pecten maximus]|uniref:uncharacterized protein LOC117331009 n=1 Tax=Pecten maximus TaxID=6579 RepID=UPI001458CA4C|nr:uncharacterized protein LOC117331009 [Pecten maximus]
MTLHVKAVVLLVIVTEALSSMICSSVCRDQKNVSVPCSLRTFSEYDTILLYPPPKDHCGPSKPVEFKGHVLYPPDHLKAVLVFTWRSPDDSSIKDLVGFQITVTFPTRQTESPTQVFRIRFDNSSTHRDWSYQLSCTYTKPSIDVRVNAYCQSLPMCDNHLSTYNLSINVTPQQDKDEDLNVDTASATERWHPASTIPSKPDKTVVAVVVSVVLVISLTGLVWFLRYKVLKTKELTLNSTRKGREPSDGRSTNSRHGNTTSKARDADQNTPTKFHIEQNNVKENNSCSHMNFPVYPKGPCPVHGCLSPIATDTPVAAVHSQKNRIHSGGDTFSREQILLKDFRKREPQAVIAGERDDICMYNSTRIEEKWLKLNEEIL